MADVMYVIGAKDEASPTLKNVDRSMSRLEKSTKELGDSSDKSLSKFSFSIGSLAKAAGILGGIALAVQGVRSVFGMIASGVDDFDAATESVRALDQAMELNGGSSEALVGRYTALADAIEASTNITAEETQVLIKQAAVLGVSNEQLGDMATAAIGLSEALGVSLEDGLNKARLATEGNFKSFEKLLPAIKEMKTSEEKLAAVMELSARGMALKEAASKNAAGEAERMNHRLGNLFEAVGALIAPLQEVTYKGIALLADGLANMLGPAVEYTQELFTRWEPAIMGTIEATVNAIIAGVTMAEVVFGNFGTVVGLVFDTLKLRYETYRADTEHLFVTTIPAYITWFADNFYNIIETAFSAVQSLITNALQNITDSFLVFFEFLRSGGSSDIMGQLGEIAGRSYLEGFESTIGELPIVAARSVTATEQALQAAIGKSADKLAEEYATKLAARVVKFGKSGDPIADALKLGLKDGSGSGKSKGAQVASANESRLLTRGPGSRLSLEDGITELVNLMRTNNSFTEDQAAAQASLESAARETKTAIESKGTIMFASAPT